MRKLASSWPVSQSVINERMIADALIEAGLVTGSRLVGCDLRALHRSWTDYELLGSNPYLDEPAKQLVSYQCHASGDELREMVNKN